MKNKKETNMKNQQTTRTEKKTEAPAQNKSAISEIGEIILGRPRISTRTIHTLARVCEVFQAEAVHIEPATPRHYDPPAPDEYEEALLQA